MTSEIFADLFKEVNKNMNKKEKKKIIHFNNNCKAHRIIPEIKVVKVAFFLPNSTPKLQLLDQGLIRNFKVSEGNNEDHKFIDKKEETMPLKNFDSIRIADEALVSNKTPHINSHHTLLIYF